MTMKMFTLLHIPTIFDKHDKVMSFPVKQEKRVSSILKMFDASNRM